MAAALRETGGIAPRRGHHSIRRGSDHGFRPPVPHLLDLVRRGGTGGASRRERDRGDRAQELYRSDGREGGGRIAPGRNPGGGGGSGLAGAAATANQHRQSRCRSSDRQRSAPTRRAKPRYRATLHRGRMGTPRALAPGSGRAAQPFASQFANRADLPATGRRRRPRPIKRSSKR